MHTEEAIATTVDTGGEPRRINSLAIEDVRVMEWGHAHLETALEALENLPVFVAYNANVDAIVRVNDALEAALDRPAVTG